MSALEPIAGMHPQFAGAMVMMMMMMRVCAEVVM